MKTLKWILVGVVMVAVGLAGYWLGHQRPWAADGGEKQQGPVAQVKLGRAERSMMGDTITVFGTVIAQPGKAQSVSVAFECRVRHLLVAPGEAIKREQRLADVEPSPAARFQLAQAQAAVASANKELAQVQERYNLKFATNQELGQAQKAATAAQLQLQALEQEGIGSEHQLLSALDGIVGNIMVQDGQIVAAGTPLVEVVAREDIAVRLGVEPEDATYLSLRQPVVLIPVSLPQAKPMEGRIFLITQRVNPQTRLIDVYALPPAGAELRLEAYLRAEIQLRPHEALVVPRSAVLPQGERDVLFTIQNGHAVEQLVQVGMTTTNRVELLNSPLRPGDEVVVQGNYELTNGMAVATESARGP